MKRIPKRYLSLFALIMLMATCACGKSTALEMLQIMGVYGIDLNEEGRLQAYSSSPIFSREANKKYNITKTTALSTRQSRLQLDSMSIGALTGRKLATVLVGKKLLTEKSIYPYMDVLFRDPSSEINASIAMVDGNVSEIMESEMDDKGRLEVVLFEEIETSYEDRICVLTRAYQLEDQLLNPRITPYVTEIKALPGEIKVTGTALLSDDGKYAGSLNNKESSLLLLLQRDIGRPIQLMLDLPSKGIVTINIKNANYNMHSAYGKERFQFRVAVHAEAELTEQATNWKENIPVPVLEQEIAKQLQQECDKLIGKIQRYRVDPIGFGYYAKAYQLSRWKEVEDNWGDAFAQADIEITTRVKLTSTGAVK
ncbi:germination protein, Ger(x)C family [Paenibacillus catalpae]|uniref:Germination protein, Ger(X)C family n=1 Tax=Paenibacillus catalpae TaxID=1045775 RepID=A0A1I2GJG7_9BACL|nr:Ger(x)C family spore germination protein [Paenibacillus catalpae]SFF16876.1 germination protein, Ger(x)C family [Paenibacillus catalpae]